MPEDILPRNEAIAELDQELRLMVNILRDNFEVEACVRLTDADILYYAPDATDNWSFIVYNAAKTSGAFLEKRSYELKCLAAEKLPVLVDSLRKANFLKESGLGLAITRARLLNEKLIAEFGDGDE